MQTVASLADRLEMSAETAVEKLRYMMFDIESVESTISDEVIDILIDLDDDPEVAERVRETKLKEIEKAQKRAERLQNAAKKAAAKRKAAAKKEAAAKAKAKPKAKRTRKKKAEPEGEAKAAVAEILPEEAARPVAEILPATPAQEEPETKKKTAPRATRAGRKKTADGPAITIGSAIDHEDAIALVRADGTPLETPEPDLLEAEAEAIEEEAPHGGLLAEAERRQEEQERRKARLAARPLPKPDPAVVAEVIRKAAERGAKKPPRIQPRAEKRRSPTGKTARKRAKRAERMRVEETLRREAAAAVREYQASGFGAAPKKRKRKRDRDGEALGAAMAEEDEIMLIEIEEAMSIEELADEMECSVNDIILELMDHNVLATKNQSLSIDLVRAIAEPKGYDVRTIIPEEAELLAEIPDDPADLTPRPPVITVMGHVDHGKTTLLDHVRVANVADGEAGGITQHIAAYEVKIGDGSVTFLDTPGHEAFTQMRARGAHVTDVVVLVVAADDGVMPQTIEAIDHAKAADVPIVVAINKCDKPEAEPDRIRQELTRYELVDEQWGGKTIMKNIAAKTGDGVADLMELLVLESELLELKANPKKRARGAVIESEISRGMGPVAWVLVQSGTLRVGDVFLAGNAYGRVRAMHNSRGEAVQEAGPSTPVVVTGFNGLPDAGDLFVVVQEERVARVVALQRAQLSKQKEGPAVRHITLEDFHERMMAGEKHELNVVLKADVQGYVDVLESSMSKLGNEEVQINLVHRAVGGINESDVLLASASDAVVIGFHVTANAKVRKLAEEEGVDIRTYRVIYEAIDDVRKALEGMLTPETKEVITGHAEIRAVFRSSSFGNIAGCYVQDGEIVRGSNARLVRDDVVVHESAIASLRREKDDMRSVQSGFECGIKLQDFEDIKVGDVVEGYRLESVAKTLA